MVNLLNRSIAVVLLLTLASCVYMPVTTDDQSNCTLHTKKFLLKGTNAGNLANYYAGISYLKMKNYEKGIEYLENFKSDDQMLGPVALGAIGDAFADINQPEDALDYYEKAANKKNNEFTTPLFLFKAGQTAMELKNYSKAESLFAKIKENYSKSDQGRDIEKFISAAKYAN